LALGSEFLGLGGADLAVGISLLWSMYVGCREKGAGSAAVGDPESGPLRHSPRLRLAPLDPGVQVLDIDCDSPIRLVCRELARVYEGSDCARGAPDVLAGLLHRQKPSWWRFGREEVIRKADIELTARPRH
jgi:hypothetical protein